MGAYEEMIVYSDPSQSLISPYSLHREKAHSSFIEAKGFVLDFPQWLPFAAKVYNISPHIKDYVLVPVITIPSDLPNRNGVAFPLKSLIRFSPETGMQAYKTFKGKPVHYEHDNKNPLKALGVIADVSLRRLKGYGNGKIWKVVELLALDRTKYTDIVNAILKKEIVSYSMGALVSGYRCSYCGKPNCEHIDYTRKCDFYVLNGKLVFREVDDFIGYETSVVSTPAFMTAISDIIIHVDNPLQYIK